MKDDIQNYIQNYMKLRNQILRQMDIDKMKVFCLKHKIPIPENSLVFLAGMHKTRYNSPSFTTSEREISKNWLIKNKFDLGIRIKWRDIKEKK